MCALCVCEHSASAHTSFDPIFAAGTHTSFDFVFSLPTFVGVDVDGSVEAKKCKR